jgi:hypothetical protein
LREDGLLLFAQQRSIGDQIAPAGDSIDEDFDTASDTRPSSDDAGTFERATTMR